MISLASVSSILGIIIPIVVAYISTRHNFRKHPREEFADDVDTAKEFELVLSSEDSQLIKDRITQKLMLTKNVNFMEAQFFYQYADMSLWFERYKYVKTYLRPLIDEKNNITDFTTKNTSQGGFYFLFLYFLFAFIALTPCIFINLYVKSWSDSIQAKQYLILVNLALWPIIFLCLAFINLNKANKVHEAHKFLKKFNKESILLKVEN